MPYIKNSALKCYLSKTIAYKEDPHDWCSVTGFFMVVEGHWFAEFGGGNTFEYLVFVRHLVFGLL